MRRVRNKIINLDFLKTEFNSGYVHTYCNIMDKEFINCIFIGNNVVDYIFNYCRLVNCTFYCPKYLKICNSQINSIMIIDNSNEKVPMEIFIDLNIPIVNDIIFKSCIFEKCTIDNSANYSNIQFIDCINNPRFYLNDKSFYGYKYSKEGYLIVLELPKNAEIYESNSSDNKCRTHKAKVVSILNTDGTYSGIKECRSWYDIDFKYEVNNIVRSFLNDSYTECTEGIHFFKTIQEAYKFYCREILPSMRYHYGIE